MAAALRGPFDLIVSNPPYIASGDIATLAPEVRDFDPRAALDGGQDGLNYYRLIAASAPALLKSDGSLVVELGVGQAPAVMALFSEAGLTPLPPRLDLQGLPRALPAKKSCIKRDMNLQYWAPAKKQQKSTWNVARNRLASGHGIGPRRLGAAPPRSARSDPPRGFAAQAR